MYMNNATNQKEYPNLEKFDYQDLHAESKKVIFSSDLILKVKNFPLRFFWTNSNVSTRT